MTVHQSRNTWVHHLDSHILFGPPGIFVLMSGSDMQWCCYLSIYSLLLLLFHVQSLVA
jgi:hypothetical protein